MFYKWMISDCNKVRAMLGDTLASFLPGITITLCKIITGDQRQGHSVIAVSSSESNLITTTYIYFDIYQNMSINLNQFACTHIHALPIMLLCLK